MTIDTLFSEAFAVAPDAVGIAPGRVNLIGEHIDYHAGTVLPMAIDRHVRVAIGGDLEGHDEIFAPNFEETTRRDIASKKSGHWSDYVAGALQKARTLKMLKRGVRVAVESTVPHGAGLSSSAAVIVATLKATAALDLNRDGGKFPANETFAHWAQEVEHDYIGMPCGIMDQMAVAVAQQGQAIALDTGTLAYTLIDLPEDYHFVVYHSGVTRRLEDGRYAERRIESEAAAEQLKTDKLCLLPDHQLTEIATLSDPLNKRARHVVSEHQRVLQCVEAIRAGDMTLVGKLMNQSHFSMRDDFQMTTPEIDRVVTGALAHGAIGARLTGGGFGGCIVACVKKDKLPDWRESMEREFPAAWFVA